MIAQLYHREKFSVASTNIKFDGISVECQGDYSEVNKFSSLFISTLVNTASVLILYE